MYTYSTITENILFSYTQPLKMEIEIPFDIRINRDQVSENNT